MTGILLQSIVASKGLGRNDLCPCGSEKKLKRCHEAIFEDLKRIGKEQLRKDLQLFKV
jgi:hypothetical protein